MLSRNLPVRIDRLAGLSTVFIASVFEEKRSNVRRADGGVYHQDQDEPVPDSFERRVVKYGPAMVTRHLQLVLGKHVRTQR